MKLRNVTSYEPMHAWGVGGESVPADVVRQMHEVRNRIKKMIRNAIFDDMHMLQAHNKLIESSA